MSFAWPVGGDAQLDRTATGEDGYELSVLVTDDDEMEVTYGWATSTPGADQEDTLNDALEFIFSALQGGVKVEV